MIPSLTISVRTNGRDIGFIIIRDAGVEAFDLDGRSIGIFSSKDDAARELWRHDRAGWVSLGKADKVSGATEARAQATSAEAARCSI
jgi:hypothetical protein